MAGETLLTLSRDEAEWAWQESKLKYELDLQSSLVDARQEGRAEGIAATWLESARKMKELGDSVEKIALVTGLSEEEIRKL
jgi:predicted transposase/invertase (TIGR01784 family)